MFVGAVQDNDITNGLVFGLFIAVVKLVGGSGGVPTNTDATFESLASPTALTALTL